MNCEQIAELLPDYLQGSVTIDQAGQIEQHCQLCNNCAQDVALWNKFALVPRLQPSPESRARFEAMLHAYRTISDERAGSVETARKSGKLKVAWSFFDWFRSPLGAAAWSVALLVIGVLIGARVGIGTKVANVASSRSRCCNSSPPASACKA
jgi:anti-sigma factor RsiW